MNTSTSTSTGAEPSLKNDAAGVTATVASDANVLEAAEHGAAAAWGGGLAAPEGEVRNATPAPEQQPRANYFPLTPPHPPHPLLLLSRTFLCHAGC
jgi:hypothetical protein